MARRVRDFDWGTTPLGPMAAWPRSLRAVVELLLGHPLPSIVLWGPDLIQVYNDGYAGVAAGEHPAELGRPARAGRPEARHLDGPTLDRVLRGESILRVDQPSPLAGRGSPEGARCTLAYGPTRDDEGRVAGVFLTIVEATGRAHPGGGPPARAGRQAFLLKLLDALRPAADPGPAQAAARVLGEHLGADRAFYAEVQGDAWRIAGAYERGVEPGAEGGHAMGAFGPRVVDELRAGRTVVVRDLHADGRFGGPERSALGACRVAGAVAVPLVREGALVAILAVQAAAPRDWDDAEVALVEEAAERTRAAIELAGWRRRGEEQDAILVRFSDVVRGVADPAIVAGAACRILTERLGTDRTTWVRIDWAAREYVTEYAFPEEGAGAPARWPLDAPQPFAAEHRAGRSVAYDDLAADPRIVGGAREAMERRGIRAGVAVPVVTGGVLRAVLHTSQRRPRRWAADEVAVVESLAGRAWAEVERAAAEVALREGEAWQGGQKAAFLAAVRGLPLAESLGELVRTVVEAMGEGARAAFYISEDGGRSLRHVVGMPEEYARRVDGFRIGPESLACGLAVATRGPVLTADVRDDPRWGPWRAMAERFDYRGCWSFPILSTSGEFVGTLAIYSRAPREATERDLKLASMMTDAAAIIISRHAESEARARAEAAFRRGEERLRMALSAARMGTWTWEVATDEHHRDANLNALLGLPAEETVRPLAALIDLIHPDDRAAVRDAFDQSVRRGRPLHVEFRVARPSGSVRWLRDQGDVFEEAGRARMTGACIDVTDLKESEAAVRDREAEFRAVAEVVPDLLWRLDPEAGTGWVNGRWVEYTGIANDAAHPWGWLEAVHPDDRANSRAAFERGMAAGEPFRFEHRLRRAADGAYRWFLVGSAPLRDEAGRIAGWYGAVTDVHDQRAARDELEARVADRTAELARALGTLEEEMARRRELARRLGTAQEDERRRVSRDLHDSVGQLLAALPIAFRAVEGAGGLPAPAAAKLAEARRMVDAVSREVHTLAVRLRPTALDDLGLEAALDLLVAEWSARSGVPADFQAIGLGPGRLPAEVETAIYRVVQEALTNVARHARAAIVSVVVRRTVGHATAVVEDDGVGFAPEAVPGGRLGLVGMRERVALVGGELAVESGPGAGTSVLVRIPLHEGGGAGRGPT